MIDKREILAIAQQTSLTPHVVEKDYVLGWIACRHLCARGSFWIAGLVGRLGALWAEPAAWPENEVFRRYFEHRVIASAATQRNST